MVLTMTRRIFYVLLVVWAASVTSVYAQETIRAYDTVANALADPGDSTNQALRVNIVVDPTSLSLDQNTSGQKAGLVMGAVTTSAPTYTTAKSSALSLQTDGSLRVAVSNTIALPTGASTAAAQTTAQTSFSSMLTSLQLIDDVVYNEDVAAQAADKGVAILAVRRDADTTLVGSDNDYAQLQVNAGGQLKVACIVGCSATTVADDATFTDGSSTGQPIMAVAESTSPSTVTNGKFGVVGMTLNRAMKATLYDSSGNELATASDVQEDAPETAGGYGPMMLAVRRDTAAASCGTSGDNCTVNEDATGNVYVTTMGTPGDSVFYKTAAGTTEDEHEVKGSAGRLMSVSITNTASTVAYWRCANQVAASTTPGTTTVFMGNAIPGSTTGDGFVRSFGPNGAAFSTGLTCWFVTGAADSDVTEVAANSIKATYSYR